MLAEGGIWPANLRFSRNTVWSRNHTMGNAAIERGWAPRGIEYVSRKLYEPPQSRSHLEAGEKSRRRSHWRNQGRTTSWVCVCVCVCVSMCLCVCVLVAQSCLTLCNHMDCSLLGSSAHEILQARILEWVAIPFSRGFS